MSEDLDGVTANIRACIMSSKGPLPVRNLMRDYDTLVGNQIPFRKFGHPSIESFLQSVPSLHVIGSGRDSMVEAASSKSSSHITSLIAKQKSTKKKDFGPPRRFNQRPVYGRARGYAPRNLAPRENSYAPRESSYAPRETNFAARRYPTSNYPSEAVDCSNDQALDYGNHTAVDDREDHVESLVVKVEGNDRRQVSMADAPSSQKHPFSYKDTRLQRLPPRLQKLLQSKEATLTSPLPSPSVSETSQNVNGNLYMNHQSSTEEMSSSKTIISPLGPSQLIAAGRALKEAKLADYNELYLQDPLQNGQEFATEVPELYMENLEINVNSQSEAAAAYEQFGQLESFQGAGDQLESFQGAGDQQPTLMMSQGLVSFAEAPLSPPVPLADKQNITNNIHLLLQYTMDRGWVVPEYTIITRKPKGSRPLHTGKVTLREGQSVKKYSSYPHEDENVNLAKGYAAKNALEVLHEEEKVKLKKKKINTDKKIICDRISDIVSGMCNGLFSNNVEERYVEKYMESLPDDWIQTLNSCSTVSMETSLNNIIIRPRDPTTEPVFNEIISAPAPLEAPLENEWNVFITHATSSSSVWFRLIGELYSEKYDKLLIDMSNYYERNGTKEKALCIEEGHYYAAQCADGWFRICACEVNYESNMVTAWFIDNGESDMISFGSLYRLLPEFIVFPKQAVQCSLDGLESLNDDADANKIITYSSYLIGNTAIARVTDREEEPIKVVLFDTSGDDDININELLLDNIVLSTPAPQLPNVGHAMEVYISSVSNKGEVYIHIPGPACNRIIHLVQSLETEEINKNKLTSYRQIGLNKIYLAKYSANNAWYRAVVTTTPSVQQNKIAVQFVDFGNTETVSINDIAGVENLPPIINKLPPQAIQVALHNLPIDTLSNSEIATLHSLLLDDEDKVLLIKTVDLIEDPPLVQIFYKNNDSALVSVNSTIELQRALTRPEEKKSTSFDFSAYNSNLNAAFKNVPGAFNTHLKRPELDEDFLPVSIVLAANPGNFIFQPLKYAKELKTLMQQLQAYYEATTFPELTKEEVVKGGLYAARYTDEAWYRVIVTEIIVGSKVSVRLCDYGDMMCVDMSDLRALAKKFCQCPFMAIKGKLSGVLPAHIDWSVEDCIRFQDLVVNKVLASTVVNIEDNLVNPLEMVVTLHLVDTNTEKDERIADILVNENRAVREVS